jgi:DNA-binding NarL/FixJ family response regulator
MVVAGEASNGQEALEKVWQENYDVVVLDISMPGKSGLAVLKELKSHRPELPVLILSMHSEDQYAVRCLRAGAAGYLTKEGASDELVAAVRKVSRGKKYVTSTVAERLAYALEVDTYKALHETLSDREYEVLCMIARGKTVGQIADSLHLSVKTISTYRTRILEKMRMKTNAQLMHYAIENGLVT